MREHWLKKLEQLVRKHPLAVLRLDSEQQETLCRAEIWQSQIEDSHQVRIVPLFFGDDTVACP